MPRLSRRTKKRQPRRKKRSYGAMTKVRQGVPRGAAPFPFGQSLFTKLKSTIYYDLSAATYYESVYVAINGLYDSFLTTSNVRPLGFDEIANLYLTYQCFGAQCTVRYVSSTATPTMVGITSVLDIASGTYSSAGELSAAPGGVTKLIMPSANQTRTATLRMKRSAAKALGLTKNQYQDTNYSSFVTANPSEMAYFAINFLSINGATAVDGFAIIDVEYLVKFSGRKQLALS